MVVLTPAERRFTIPARDVTGRCPEGECSGQGMPAVQFEEIVEATITFTVPVSWLDEHGFTLEEIVMYQYNGTAWDALPTWVVDDSGATVTFTATTPGFSLFAISGAGEIGEATTTPTATTPPATAEPTATQTTAAPAGGAAPDFPLGTIALAGGMILVLAVGGYLVRRWWISG